MKNNTNDFEAITFLFMILLFPIWILTGIIKGSK